MLLKKYLEKGKSKYTETIIKDSEVSYKTGIKKIERNHNLVNKKIEAVTKITIPNSVTEIGDAAFVDYINLKEIIIPDSVKVIGKLAFNGTSLEQIDIPDSVVELGDYAFLNCRKLKYAKLSKNMKAINQSTFLECRVLEDVIFPQKIEIIKQEAFRKCTSLKSLAIPDSVSVIEFGAFADCVNLETVILSQNIEVINSFLFYNCYNLKKMHIPSACKKIDTASFQECRSLSEIIIPDTVEEIEAEAFSLCSCLSKIHLPTSLKVIKEATFYECKSLNAIDLHEGLVEIKNNAFCGCGDFKDITIPKSLKKIGDNIFFEKYFWIYKIKDLQFHFDCDNCPSTPYYGEYLKVENGIFTISLKKFCKFIENKGELNHSYGYCIYGSEILEFFFDIIKILLNENNLHYINQNNYPVISFEIKNRKFPIKIKDNYYITARTKERAKQNNVKWIEYLAKNMDNNNLEAKELYLSLIRKENAYEGMSVTERFEL